jgi:glycine cleavage system T protein
MRNNVGLLDLTGLSIFEVKGPGATAFLNLLCTNQMEVPPGTVVYTAWLTPRGGIQRDLTVARLATDRYWIFVGEGTRPLDFAWMDQHAPEDGSVALSDISDGYTGLGLWGPNARKVLQHATHADVSNEMFPYFTAQWIDIGPVPVFAMRISYVGELGWELHIPIDSALPVWDRLWQAGQTFEMAAVGTGAMDSLRIEKGYRLWGGDIYTEYNLYEAGLGWLAKMDKGDFIGREATLSAKEKGIRKKLCCLTFEEPDAVAIGYEPIFGDNACIGHVTTSNFGYTLGRQIAHGYLPKEYSAQGTKLEVEYFNRRFAATVQAEPLYDPRMTRLK